MPTSSRPPNDNDRARIATLRALDQLQRALGRRERAASVAALAELVTLRAPMGEQWLRLSLVAADLGEIALARTAVDLFVEHFGGSTLAQFRKVGLLAHVGAFADALALVRTLPADTPDRFAYAVTRGAAALNVGEMDEARAWLEQATVLRPAAGSAWHSLATLVDFADEPALAERLIGGAPPGHDAPAAERATYAWAVGKAQADRRRHAEAFAGFAQAARVLKGETPYDPERDRRGAAEAVRGYDAARIASVAGRQSEPTARTIFVTGLPRSGTTLVEQVLTGHSAVTDGGEIDRLRMLAREIDGLAWPDLAQGVDRIGAPPLARLWDHWIGERFPGSARIVDKTVTTSRLLGLAAALLPEAPLVWLTRDPLDCAWSCFRTMFLQALPWSNDLHDIALHFRLEDALLARWRDILGERLLVVPYEDLVRAPEDNIRRILAHCGLGEEPGAFAPHENPRAVATSSVMQVRRPINRGAIGAAEPYWEYLQPFVDAYYG